MEQNALERGGSEGCFVFTIWLVVAFDFVGRLFLSLFVLNF